MPMVRITYKGKAERTSVLIALQKKLQQIIATELNVPNVEFASLVPDDVELEFEKAHSFNVGKDLHILVLANWFEAREKNLQERTDQISAEVRKLLSGVECDIKGFVYVRLAKVGFSEF